MKFLIDKINMQLIWNKMLWSICGLILIFSIGIGITYEKWLYLTPILIPLLIYFFMKKPFIFPLGLYIFFLPLDSLLSVTDKAEGLKLTKLLGIFAILVLLLRGSFEKKLRQPNVVAIYWTLLTLFGLLSIVWALDPTIAQQRFSTAIGMLILYIVVTSYKIEKDEFNAIKVLIIAGGLLAAIATINNYISGVYYIAQRVSLKFGEASSNPNLLGFSLLIPISVCIEMMFEQKKKRITVFFAIVLTLMLLCIILTGSRGTMLGVGAIFIVYFFSIRKKFAFVSIAILVGIILVPFISDLYIERWESSLETGGSGRISIWYASLMVIKKYWFLGAGLNNFPIAFNEFADYATATIYRFRDPHNTYMTIFGELGIIGFLLVVLGMWKHYQAIRLGSVNNNYSNTQIMLMAAFWAILVSCFFGSYFWKKSFWLLWMMILMHRNVVEMEINKNKTIIDSMTFVVGKK
jgi:O-antigen ligase